MKNYIPYPFFHDDVPVDISFVFADEKPAGKHGFLKTAGKDFVFEDGTKVKFWGTNLNGWACFPEHDYAEKLARRLGKIGLNLVRFHQFDAQWNTPNLFAFTKGQRFNGSSFDPESMDRMDYLIYCLKKEGIYCYLDMLTYRKFRSDEGVENAHMLIDGARPVCIFDDHLIELQKDFCCQIWTHVNPYTKLAYCDDPVFVMTDILSEGDLFGAKKVPECYMPVFHQKMDKWLAEQGITDKKASDFSYEDNSNDTVMNFKIYLQEEYYRQMYSYMRQCGVKIPITGTNQMYTAPANAKTQLITDFFDSHHYRYDWQWGEFQKRCNEKAITQSDNSFLMGAALAATADRPSYLSEWDVPWPNEYRAESPIYCAALGMLQNWSGFAIHTYAYTSRTDRMNILGSEIYSEKIGDIPYRQGIFSTWNDPAKFGLFYHAALITRRGDVKPAKGTVTIAPLSKAETDWDAIAAHIVRTGVISDLSFREVKTKEKAEVAGDILSDTGELFISRAKNYGYVDTEKTKCAYGFLCKNGTIDLSGVSITCTNDFAVIAMSSLTDESICHSSNILLTTVGRAENTNFKYENGLMTDYGTAPVLIESITADIAIETDVQNLVAWAISPEGFFIGTLPSRYEDGKFKFNVGERSKSMYHLIFKE